MNREFMIEEKIERLKKSKANYNENLINIKMTNDYKQFKNIIGNRQVKSMNFAKLIASIKEKQLIIPIVCNDKMEIIDGQHRFEACKKLKYPIYYYVIPGYGIQDVQKANLISCNWNIDDYLNLFVKLGKEEYLNFMNIKKEHGLSTSLLLEIYSVFEDKNVKELKYNFKNGLHSITNIMQVYTFLNCLDEFKYLKEYRSASFVRAFLKLYSYEKYDHHKMKRKLKNLYYKLEKKNIMNDYITLLVDDIYCFGSTSDKFRYDGKSKKFYSIA